MMLLPLAQAGIFTQPAAMIVGAAAASIPILIHLLTRLRRRPQPWGAMRFLRQAQRRHRHRLRLEQWLLLLLRCLIPIVLGLALSGLLLERGLAWLRGTPGQPGRWVCLVIDDSLSTQAVDTPGQPPRFDQLQAHALHLIDELTATDRVGIWRAGRPGEMALPPDLHDRDTLRHMIKSLRPRHSRSDLANTIAAAQASIDQRAKPADPTFIVLISDLANDTLPLDQNTTPQLKPLGQRGKLLVTRPAPDAANTQITQLRPLRRRIFPTPMGHPPVLPVVIQLTRFVGQARSDTTHIELAVYHEDDTQPLTTHQAQHRWSPGQTHATLNLTATLNKLQTLESNRPGVPALGERMLTLKASIQPTGPGANGGDNDAGDGTADAIKADDQRWAVVAWQPRLSVGIIDQQRATALGSRHHNRLRPGWWVRLALTAIGTDPLSQASATTPSGTQWIDLEPPGLSQNTLRTLDAVLVLQPDLLQNQDWGALRTLLKNGGLVWVFPPPGDAPALWGKALRDQFDLDWLVSVEPPTEHPDHPMGQPLAVDRPTPQPLSLLGADWKDLLQPIRVRKQLDVTIGRAGAAPTEVWLATADGKPILIYSRIGDGQALLSATAIDPTWTNLPTKPLFVPLLNETLYGVLGQSGLSTPHHTRIAGDHTTLDPNRWGQAQALVLQRERKPQRDRDQETTKRRLRRTDNGLVPHPPLDTPGVYTAQPTATGQAIAVNPDAKGGNTRTVDLPRLEQWLTSIGPWAWIDHAQLTKSLAVEPTHANLSWPLLWVTLGFVLAEMCLARWFSHALAPAHSIKHQQAIALKRGLNQGRARPS